MAGRIRQEDVETVRERSDIVQTVSGYLQLKKAGRDSLVGLCPFHAEKTPSFSVSPSKQVYYCFGCGEGGDVFGFLGKIENLSFGEAVEMLARQAGITLRFEGQSPGSRRAEGRRQAIHRVIAEAATVYNRTLLERPEAAEARRYLESRGITAESVDRFGIGYAPSAPDFLLKRLSRTYSPELLLEAGLAMKDPSGGLRDQFRGRVMFPVHDLAGNGVGFGGRLLAGEKSSPGLPKYKNSPDGPVYHKSRLLYNLNRAKAEVTRTGRAILVEGYTDVIALDQGGARNVMATCGTALGEDHLRQLARFTDRVVLAFDSDDAGARAAERAFQFHQQHPVQLSVLVLPEGHDPADFVMANGGDAFLELADQAVPLIGYMLDRLVRGRDLSDVERRAMAIRDGLAIVAELEDPVSREEYARRLAGRVGESENAVMLELESVLGRQGAPPVAAERSHRGRLSPEEEVEWEVLKLLVQAPELCSAWLSDLDATRFGKPTHRKVFEAIVESQADGRGRDGDVSALVARALDQKGEQVGRVLAALAVERPKAQGEPTVEYAERLFLRLEEFSLKRRADVIRKELERVNPLKAPADHETLFEQLIELEGARRRVRAAAEEVRSM